nr:NUDIX domain-containing protein [Amycolatopsis anabasis]
MLEVDEKHLAYSWIVRDGAILFLRRQAAAFLGGTWELPGGTVEPDEPPELAAVRETAEETGLGVRIIGERSHHTWMDVAGRALRIRARTYDVREDARAEVVLNPAEHDEFAWLSPAEAAGLDLMWHVRQTLTNTR